MRILLYFTYIGREVLDMLLTSLPVTGSVPRLRKWDISTPPSDIILTVLPHTNTRTHTRGVPRYYDNRGADCYTDHLSFIFFDSVIYNNCLPVFSCYILCISLAIRFNNC